MVPAAEAIRGHRSAHSLATGPVMAEPFISPLGFTITPARAERGGSGKGKRGAGAERSAKQRRARGKREEKAKGQGEAGKPGSR